MKEHLEGLFLRFRNEDDVAALGSVFDLAAPELMRVARHLAGDEAEAEDALQATFQTAIEKKLAWEPDGRVLPWMLGILELHVRKARQRAERAIEEDRLAPRTAGDPSAVVADQEVGAIVAERIAELPESYSAAVHSYLVEGKPAREIARSLGITANAASVRLHRGLKLLQRALPAGVSLGAAGAVLGSGRAQGLPTLRDSVMHEAARHAGPASTLAGGSGGTLVALLTGKNSLLVTGVAALVAGALYLSPLELSWSRSESTPGGEPIVLAREEQSAEILAAPPAPVPAPSLGVGREVAADSGEPAIARAPLDPEAWLARFVEAKDWREAWAIARELARLPGEDSLAVLRAIYQRIPVADHRRQVLKPFVFDPRHRNAVEILHLAMTDESLEVQKTALHYLRELSFLDFAEDVATYDAWYSRFGRLPVNEVVLASASDFVGRLHGLQGAELLREIERFRYLRLDNYGELSSAVKSAMMDAGLLRLIEGWLVGGDSQLSSRALSWASEFDPDEAWLRNHVVPLLQAGPEDELVHGAANALGKEGNAWAIPLLFDSFLALPAEARPTGYSQMRALADIGDPTVIPKMIAILVADPETHYSVGYFGLAEFTGVDYDESHGAEFWLAWWENNQQRLPAEVRGMSLPHVALTR